MPTYIGTDPAGNILRRVSKRSNIRFVAIAKERRKGDLPVRWIESNWRRRLADTYCQNRAIIDGTHADLARKSGESRAAHQTRAAQLITEAVADTGDSPDVAAYIARHRPQLEEYLRKARIEWIAERWSPLGWYVSEATARRRALWWRREGNAECKVIEAKKEDEPGGED
jgi:hypothetical protein